MYGAEGNSWFCFPESPRATRDEHEGNIRSPGKTKLASFPRDQTLSALLYIIQCCCIRCGQYSG